MRPELTGRGQGHRYVAAVIDFAVKTTGTTALRVTIATFNRRAQQVWRRAGFVQTGTFARPFDNMEFVIMEKGA